MHESRKEFLKAEKDARKLSWILKSGYQKAERDAGKQEGMLESRV